MPPLFCLKRVAADVPAQCMWLTPAESVVLEGFRFAKRRNDWLLGRWTAKLASLRYLGLHDESMSRLEILAAADGAPQLTLDGESANLALSISHSEETAFCAVSNSDIGLGCDIEQTADRGRAFAETFLTARERLWVDATPDTLQSLAVTLIWSFKESVLKVTREGLRADTWSVDVDQIDELRRVGWQALHARRAGSGREFCGWWQAHGGSVMTVAADAKVDRPESLDD